MAVAVVMVKEEAEEEELVDEDSEDEDEEDKDEQQDVYEDNGARRTRMTSPSLSRSLTWGQL